MDPPDLWTAQRAGEVPGPGAAHGALRAGRRLGLPRAATPRARSTGARAPAARPTSRGCWCRLEDINPGCYDAKARVEALDLDGIDAELLFPERARLGRRLRPTASSTSR